MKPNFNNSCGGAFKDTLDIKLTDSCNGNCKFCIERGGKSSKPANVRDLIEKVKSIDPRSVLILGGEPFLYPKLAEFLEGISGRQIFITTNGSKLKDKRLIKSVSPYLTAVNISIMHFGMEKHFEISGIRINPIDIKESISILKEHCVSVRINTILLKSYLDNKNDCDTMIEFAKWLNVNDIRFSEVQNYPDMFVDAKIIFKGLNKNPYVEGCEQKISENGINVFIKQTCSLVNNKKKDGLKYLSDGCGKGCLYLKEGVLYPDLAYSKSGWLKNGANEFSCQ